MKATSLYLGAFFTSALFLGASPVQGQLIMDNNFNSVSAGIYDGQTGEQFGADALLGNATYFRDSSVQATGGVGNSAYNKISSQVGIRSRNTASTTTKTNFSFSYLFSSAAAPAVGSATNNNPVVGAGWGIAPDNNGGLFNDSAAEVQDRIFVGMGYDGSNFVLGYFVDFDARKNGGNFDLYDAWEPLTGTGGDDLIVGSAPASDAWYSMSFDLEFNDTTDVFTVSDFTVRDGTSSIVASLASSTFTADSLTVTPAGSSGSSALNTTTTANAVISGWNSPGALGLDNVTVTAIPEPSSLTLLTGTLGLLLLMRRRRI